MHNHKLIVPGLVVGGMLVLATTAELPYAYYQFLRWIACGAAALFAYSGFETGRKWAPFLFVPIAILFNPLRPIHMHKADWRPFDIAAAVIFVACGLVFSGRGSRRRDT